MNDDLLTPQTPTSSPDGAGDDTNTSVDDPEGQNASGDRVFDFSDGDIKPVTDADGPVTHSVNLQVAEALRKAASPTPNNTPSPAVAPIPDKVPRPGPGTVSSPSKQSSPASTSQNSATSESAAPAHPIPHPAIDASMRPAPIKIYSQIHHEKDGAVAVPTSAPYPIIQEEKLDASKDTQQVPPTPEIPRPPSQPARPPVVESSLQEVLKKAYSKAARPKIDEDNLLDKKIGDLRQTAFTPAPGQRPSTSPSSIRPGPDTGYREPIDQISTPRNGQKGLQDAIKDITMPRNQPGIGVLQPTEDPKAPSSDTYEHHLSNETPDNPKATTGLASQISSSQSSLVKPIRTYESDVASVLAQTHSSVASIALAEHKKHEDEDRIGDAPREKPSAPSHAFTKIIMMIASLMLISGGAYAGYYFYQQSPLAPVTPRTLSSEQTSVIPSDTISVVPIDGQVPVTILSRIRDEIAKSQNPDTIKELVFSKADSAGGRVRISGPEMISLMDIDAPDTIVRTLVPEWMLGVYMDGEGQGHPFVVAQTTFFQNAFAGMLQWEQVMADDLKQYLRTPVIPAVGQLQTYNASTSEATMLDLMTESISASSTATTSPTEPVYAPPSQISVIRGGFQDRLVHNKDVRVFRTSTGETLFLYSFIDDQRLILTDSEATLAELLDRLDKKSSIR